MKVLIFTDIHISPHKGSYQRLDDGLDVLEWVCQTALDNKIDTILFLGDLFQDRQKIQVLAYQKTFATFQKYQDRIKWYILLGNHDLWYLEKWDVSSVIPLSAINGVTVINEAKTIKIGEREFDWLPFVKNPLKIITDKFPIKDRGNRILCAHIAIDKAKQNSFYHSSEISVEFEGDMVRIDKDYFKDWQLVLLGHYHTPQHLTDKIQYIGSPWQINFSEANQDKHIMILDLENLEMKYIKNDFSPKHLIIKEKDLGKVDLKNNYVQIIDDLGKFDIFETKKKFMSDEIRSLEFREEKSELDLLTKEKKEKFDLTEGETLEKYIETINPSQLDKSLLLKIGQNIVFEKL